MRLGGNRSIACDLADDMAAIRVVVCWSSMNLPLFDVPLSRSIMRYDPLASLGFCLKSYEHGYFSGF